MDYRGKLFGKWMVLGDAPDRLYRTKIGYINRRRYLYCECVCGIRKAVNLDNIKHGRTTQCGSCSATENNKRHRKYDLKEKYGRWTVLSNYIVRKGHLLCECRCECGNISFVYCYDLRKGTSPQCRTCRLKGHGRKQTTNNIAINHSST